MTNQFTKRVTDIIQYSKEEANRLRNDSITPEHLLLGMIREGEGKAIQILESLYVDIIKVKAEVISELRKSSIDESTYTEQIELSEKTSRILKLSLLEANILKCEAADSEHLLLAIMRDHKTQAATILEDNEVSYEKIFEKLHPKSTSRNGILGNPLNNRTPNPPRKMVWISRKTRTMKTAEPSPASVLLRKANRPLNSKPREPRHRLPTTTTPLY